MENNCVKLFRNPSATVKVMVQTVSDGWTHKGTHTPNCHFDNYVLLTASRLNKKPQFIYSVMKELIPWDSKGTCCLPIYYMWL